MDILQWKPEMVSACMPVATKIITQGLYYDVVQALPAPTVINARRNLNSTAKIHTVPCRN